MRRLITLILPILFLLLGCSYLDNWEQCISFTYIPNREDLTAIEFRKTCSHPDTRTMDDGTVRNLYYTIHMRAVLCDDTFVNNIRLTLHPDRQGKIEITDGRKILDYHVIRVEKPW